MDRQTAIQRIVQEVHKESDEDADLAIIALLKAMDFYSPHRFEFNETNEDLPLEAGKSVYPREEYFATLERLDYVKIAWANNRWENLNGLHYDEFVHVSILDEPEKMPRFWTWHGDAFNVWPVPDKVYQTKIVYTHTLDNPIAIWDGDNWTFVKSTGGSAWLVTDTCVMLTRAPELMIARAKWDLYFNVYDDAENAQKMQSLVDIEYSRLAKKLSNVKTGVYRRPVRI